MMPFFVFEDFLEKKKNMTAAKHLDKKVNKE
jgi:hypothetical protein